MNLRCKISIALFLTVLSSYAQEKKDKEYFLLIGTYTSTGKSEGIYVYDYNGATGNATFKTKANIQNPSYLAISKDHKKVYSVSEMGKGNGAIVLLILITIQANYHSSIRFLPEGTVHAMLL